MVEERKEKRNERLRISCGVICLACAAIAVACIFLLFGAVIVNIGGAEEDVNYAGITLGAILLGFIYALITAAVAISCLISGILVLANRTNGRGMFFAAAILALFDVIEVVSILFMSIVTREGGGAWFAALAVPFVADAAMRIACAAVNFKHKETCDE